MSEKLLSKKVVKSLKGLHPVPVDNPRKAGTPDVNYIEGWLELKYLKTWPKRVATKVKVRHWTKQQKIWHYLRSSAGGKCFVLLQVGGEYLLFEGGTASLFLNEACQETMKQLAIKVWQQYPGEELCKFLK